MELTFVGVVFVTVVHEGAQSVTLFYKSTQEYFSLSHLG